MTNAERMQSKIEDLVNAHFPNPIRVRLEFTRDAALWTGYEDKIGSCHQVPEGQPIRTPPKFWKGYLLTARHWEPSFGFETEDGKMGVYYSCITDVKEILNGKKK
ncbi:hypothetical protein HY492_03290 [Candidatus Woesearchaeota archaeon]|nr:hypothetical protein [Candidatus Woesearchaeota archaeon]